MLHLCRLDFFSPKCSDLSNGLHSGTQKVWEEGDVAQLLGGIIVDLCVDLRTKAKFWGMLIENTPEETGMIVKRERCLPGMWMT